MADLIDFGFLIISLAVIGYILKDAFFFYRKYTTPYELQKGEDRIFSYISIAILVISFVWLGILVILKNEPGYLQNIQPILEGFQTILDMKLISAEQISISLFYFISFLYLFTILAFFIALVLGIAFVYIDRNAISVTLSENSDTGKEFKRIICESEDFVYVESLDNFRNWEAIRKDEIKKINNIIVDSRAEKFFIQHFGATFRNNAILNNRFYRAIIILGLLIIFLLIVLFSNFISTTVVRILLVMLLIPITILFLMHSILERS